MHYIKLNFFSNLFYKILAGHVILASGDQKYKKSIHFNVDSVYSYT